MKNLCKFCLIFMFSSAFANDKTFEYYDELFNSLSKQRFGLSKEQIDNSIDPFISIKQAPVIVDTPQGEQAQEPKKEYALYAILNNRAKINDEWYEIGDIVKEYKLSSILERSVKLLKDNDTLLELELKKGNNNVLITHN